MKKLLSVIAVAGLTAAAMPAIADGNRHVRMTDTRITVSCARFALPGVIWDKPQAVFIDDLVAAGYTQERAYAIGMRVCRDEALVGNTTAMGATMRNILRTTPPR
ncbi:hypothetical protein [Jannaschia formosa]|uniref:hypothetical protein n=1 Tax=Jannaschia formosa TaxID=2259592 RepID=UPI000E1B8FC7|nr:hypothetical protein [Jannaschia formosa]TFL17316.1 hypothetical protein DR046_15075 [Jannaschia formosa]